MNNRRHSIHAVQYLFTLLKPEPRNSDVDAVLKKLIDRFFIIFVATGTLSLAGSLIRVLQFGLMFQQVIHTVVYFAFIFSFLIRKKFTVQVISIILFSIAGIDAIANLATFGLASTGTLMLGYVIIMMATFVGFGAGLITMLICTGLIIGFGITISSGIIPMNFDETRYVTSMTAWITQTTTFIVMVATAVIATCAIKSRLLDSLQDLEQKKNDVLRTNQHLVTSEKKIRAIVDTAPESIIITDLNCLIGSSNQVTLRLLGYSVPEDLSGKFFGDLIAPEHRDTTVASITGVLDKNIIRDIECEMITVHGNHLPVKMAVSLFRNDEEQPSGYLMIMQDMSLARELEQHHLQAEKLEAIGQLAGGIAHDFNNQLTGIIGFAEMLRLNLPKQSEYQQDIQGILHTAGRASLLIHQLLAFARKGKQQSVSFNLHQIITEVAQILERTIDKGISIQLHLESPHVIANGDPSQIQNAILNLALNARDAMPEGGTLTLATSFFERLPDLTGRQVDQPDQCNGYIAVTVSDTGCGIDESIQKNIFDPFFTTKEPGKGTGMGLASVYGTIKNHNGAITVSSESEHGTEMTVYLPHEPGTVENNPTEPSLPMVSTDIPANLLLVDDEKLVAQVTASLLKARGYSVVICANGSEGAEYYRNHFQSIDLVILDMVMPNMNGKAACDEIKRILPSQPVLLYSGHIPYNYEQLFASDASIDFIAKPYHPQEFFGKIERLLKGVPKGTG
ncbi:MAG: response regulator [Chitinispirillaceae bacterium]|nr:response regulator [Chitinispirillaceae bacterium]